MAKMSMQDVLAQKEVKLEQLNKRSDATVQLVRTALDGLSQVDVEIGATISEIDAMQQRMTDTRSGLEARRNKNQQIMHNFKSLLCEE